MYPFGAPPPEPERQPTEPEQAAEPEDNDDIDPFLYDKTLRWRASQLRRNGMNPRQARALALDRRIDVHYVVDRLLKRGCHPDIAFDIASH